MRSFRKNKDNNLFPGKTVAHAEVQPERLNVFETARSNFMDFILWFYLSASKDPPYLMRSGEDYQTNTKYEGFLVDMLDQLADVVGFQYEINMATDGIYGRYDNATQSWTGLVGKVIAGVIISIFILSPLNALL